MKAIVYNDYGSPDVLELADIEKPIAGDDDVLVRVRASSVNPLDWHYMRGTPYPLRMGNGAGVKRLGHDFAGQVEATGRNVTRLQPGDAVFGASRGAFAEYVCVAENKVARKPANATFEQAAAVPVAGMTALQGIRDRGRLRAGQKILINGAAGGVGTFAVQIAKWLGAEVTAVCSTAKMDMVRAIGADHVVDYTRDDFTRNAQRYDLLLDCVGNRSLSDCRRVMSSKGTYVMVGAPDGRWLGPFKRVLSTLLLSRFVSQRMVICLTSLKSEDLEVLRELIEGGKLTPVIDRSYSLSQTPEAVRYLEEGHARGKVVISLEG